MDQKHIPLAIFYVIAKLEQSVNNKTHDFRITYTRKNVLRLKITP